MACMDWTCTNPDCDWWTCNNESHMGPCPLCGAETVGWFDEEVVEAEEDEKYNDET